MVTVGAMVAGEAAKAMAAAVEGSDWLVAER